MLLPRVRLRGAVGDEDEAAFDVVSAGEVMSDSEAISERIDNASMLVRCPLVVAELLSLSPFVHGFFEFLEEVEDEEGAAVVPEAVPVGVGVSEPGLRGVGEGEGEAAPLEAEGPASGIAAAAAAEGSSWFMLDETGMCTFSMYVFNVESCEEKDLGRNKRISHCKSVIAPAGEKFLGEPKTF